MAENIPTNNIADNSIANTKAMKEEGNTALWLKGIYADSNPTLKDYNDLQQEQANLWTQLSNKVSNFGTMLQNLTDVGSKNSAQFGLMATSLVKSTEAFRNFSNVDLGRVNLFTNQFKTLIDTIENSPAGSTAAKIAIDTFGNSMQKMGASQDKIKAVLQDLKEGSLASAQSFLTGADNSLAYQQALIQNAAQQGNMTQLLAQTGTGFQRLNDVTLKHMEILHNSQAATNSSKEEMQSFMNILKELPGDMNNFGESMDIGGQKTTLLTAAMQYVTGSGRDAHKVLEDMSKAMNEYGAHTDDALKYTARMSEVSETLGARVEDVQAAINRSADAFKSFVYGGVNVNDMTKGMADSMEMYVSRLKDVGVPVKNAIEMTQNLQTSMSKLSIGQEAFYSQMSGGTGGVRGAIELEDLMKTDPAAAMRKIEESVRKMTGPLVSREQAKQSDAAANSYLRQQMIEQQFLGNQGLDRQQIAALHESMIKGGQLTLPKATGTLEETVKRGQAIEQLSATKVSQMNIQADNVMFQGGVGALTGIQNVLAARTGQAGENANTVEEERLRQFQRAHTGTPNMGNPIQELINSIGDVPTSLKDMKDSFIQNIKSGKIENAKKDELAMQQTANALKARGINQPEITAATHTDNIMKSTLSRLSTQQNPLAKIPNDIFGALQVNKALTAGKEIGAMLPQNAANKDNANPLEHRMKGPIPVTLASGSAITVNFTGKCPHCNWDINTSEIARGVNAPSQATNR